MCLAIEYPVTSTSGHPYYRPVWYPNWPLIDRAERYWEQMAIGKLRIGFGIVVLPKEK